MGYAIQAEGLAKRYGETRALDGVDLEVPQGRLLGVLGPNGAGKTTAVRILATLVRPDGGGAHVAGFDVVRQAHQVRSLIGLTGQYAAVDETLTGVENLVLLGRLLGLTRPDARRRADGLLDRFQLTDAGGRAVKTYSGGMRRRLDLAASLVGRPQVLFLEEPTTGLEPRSRTELWGVVRGLRDEGVTVLLTTQYLEEADQLADDIVVFDHGKVIASGTPDGLKAATGGQVLEVRPIEAAHLDLVRRVVADVLGVTPEVSHGQVTAPVRDPAAVPAIVRRLDDLDVVAASSRPGAGAALRHTMTLAWRSLVQIKHNPMELLDLSVQPIMFLLLFTYVFGGALALLLAFALAMSWMAVLVGVTAASMEKVQILMFSLMMPITFTSKAFVATDTMPSWLQKWVEVNPVSHLADAVRGLLGGGPVASDATISLLWAAGIIVVFAPFAVRTFRNRA